MKSTGTCAFSECTVLSEISIPNTVTNIEWQAFARCGALESVTFHGTMAEWEAITKADMWDNDIPAYTVHCTDGDLAKTES